MAAIARKKKSVSSTGERYFTLFVGGNIATVRYNADDHIASKTAWQQQLFFVGKQEMIVVAEFSGT